MATTKVDVNLIDASGITSSKYLKGDGTWADMGIDNNRVANSITIDSDGAVTKPLTPAFLHTSMLKLITLQAIILCMALSFTVQKHSIKAQIIIQPMERLLRQCLEDIFSKQP